MFQMVLFILGGVVAVMGLMVVAQGRLKLSGSSTLKGAPARIAGAAVIALGLATIGYAWFL
jgi:hypothetical protein